ncbi:SCO0930 family lipoprotein [Streptomyces sp. ICC1]|uniref:SCO0930 family lipoprotein n=1 Tax=Streptomyces sp. ICC1 TaxID=2099583 RepID=UPI001EF7F0EE|nr:SCO0930 family lipoprotein [Streptomyces sp. ICC1]
MGKKRRVTAAAGSVMTVLLLAAGCGAGSGGSGGVTAVRPAGAEQALGDGYDSGYGSAGSADPAADPAGEASAPAGRLAVREIVGVGSAVTDSAGATLYRFDKDTAQPPRSNCAADCATLWPPVPANDAQAAAGIDAGLLGAVDRADGVRQLTLGGWPVYRYAKDTRAGEAKGEGVGGTWHAVAADGKKAADKAKEKAGGAGEEQADGEQADGAGGNAEGGGLSTADDAKLGKILVNSEGRTLYRFDKDSAWPMKFGCLDACLNTWKPAAPVEKDKVSGIPAGLVGSVKRPDGSEQMTIDCWPVYLFTGDTAPGQTNGHGKQGLWFAVDDAGKKVPAAG